MSGWDEYEAPRARRVKPRARGQNVLLKAQNDQRMADIRAKDKIETQVRFSTEWHEQVHHKMKAGQRKRNAIQRKENVKLANTEMMTVRRTRLRALLENEHDAHVQELASMGLSIVTGDDF